MQQGIGRGCNRAQCKWRVLGSNTCMRWSCCGMRWPCCGLREVGADLDILRHSACRAFAFSAFAATSISATSISTVPSIFAFPAVLNLHGCQARFIELGNKLALCVDLPACDVRHFCASLLRPERVEQVLEREEQAVQLLDSGFQSSRKRRTRHLTRQRHKFAEQGCIQSAQLCAAWRIQIVARSIRSRRRRRIASASHTVHGELADYR
mmetsp:Transcript_41285/g.96501  ORF Transcript_41285/g.96501 Transcript_41285/m.96501 type:complete len:209 (-) Transcript_41285:56-682(-)